MLKAVTTGKAVGFVSDAATDFTPWGLDRPVIRLRFLAQDNQVLELRFGMDAKGNYYVNRLGTPTVMRVDPLVVSSIAVRPYEWRHARMWSLDKTNLQGISRKSGGKSELVLKYHFIDESWYAEMDGSLDPLKANYLLTTLEGLKVSRWLAADDAAAAAALVNPSIEFSVVEKVRDDEDHLKSIGIRNLVFAPASKDAVPGFYFGRVQGDRNPFLINRELYQKLAAEVLEKD